MKNRVQMLALALTAFSAYAAENGIVAKTGYTTKDSTMYLTADLKNKGGEIQLVDANTKKLEGVTNFDGNKLNPGRNFVIDGVRALADNTNATIAASVWQDNPLASVMASTLVISQGNEILNIPASDLFNCYSPAGNSDDFREISHLPIIRDGVDFSIKWVFPLTGGPGANTANLRLEFRITEVFVK